MVCLHCNTFSRLVPLFELDNSGRTRGYSFKLMKKRCRLDLRCYFFSERVVNVWNSIDQSVTASSLNSFKNNLSRLRRESMGLFMDSCVRWPWRPSNLLVWPRPVSKKKLKQTTPVRCPFNTIQVKHVKSFTKVKNLKCERSQCHRRNARLYRAVLSLDLKVAIL